MAVMITEIIKRFLFIDIELTLIYGSSENINYPRVKPYFSLTYTHSLLFIADTTAGVTHNKPCLKYNLG